MKKITREEFGKACLDYDLKSGFLIEIDGRIRIKDEEVNEGCSTTEEWVAFFGGDHYNMYARPPQDGVVFSKEPLEEDIRSIYEQLRHGLRDDVGISGSSYYLSPKA